MELFSFLILIVGGFVGGFFGSAVGSAGLVSLPILLLLGFSPHAAIGTTRPAAVVLEVISALRYRRDRILTTPLLRRGLFLGIAGAAGSTTGAIIVAGVSDQTLRLLLASIIACMAIFLCTKRQWGLVEHPQRQSHHVWMMISTFLTGLYAGFFGFTFGTLMTLVLVGFGYTMLRSAAMSRVIGAIASAASASVFVVQGYVDIPHSIALAIGFGVGGWMGARYAAKAGNRYVKILLMLVVACSVVKLLFDYTRAI